METSSAEMLFENFHLKNREFGHGGGRLFWMVMIRAARTTPILGNSSQFFFKVPTPCF